MRGVVSGDRGRKGDAEGTGKRNGHECEKLREKEKTALNNIEKKIDYPRGQD
jgi:hypothetical protein